MQTRWKPSVTVAAIIEREGKFLLVEEKSADGLRLNNPAGHLEPGESPVQACVREVLEETACAFTPTALLGVYLSRGHAAGLAAHGAEPPEPITYLRFAFCGSVAAPDLGRALDEGIVRTLWLTPDEIRQSAARHRSPMLLQGVEDYLRGQRFGLELVHTHSSIYDSL